MTDLRKLLPCPFCGGNAEFGVVPYERKYAGDDDCRINHDHGGEFIQCNNSDCSASTMLIFPTMADAKPLLIQKWNRRARIDAALAEKVEPVATWETVHAAVKIAIEKCKDASGMRNSIDTFVNAIQITHDVMGTDTIPAPADQWRRVEDAPKDGTEILAWRKDCGFLIMRWDCPANFCTDGEIEAMGEESADQYDWFCADFIAGCRLEGGEIPTHWMPFPALPEGE